jgi:hypothetical protein
MAELCTFYITHLFCGVWYPAEQCPAGSDTPLNKVLRGIIPRRTKSCGVSDPTEQHSKTNISANSKKNSKIFLGVNSGTKWGRSVEKPEVNFSCYCPFKGWKFPLNICTHKGCGDLFKKQEKSFTFYDDILGTIIISQQPLSFPNLSLCLSQPSILI